ncbi:MAG: hypothetical protein ACK5U0_08570, partial [Gemmatimonas sp.]|uniref:hypothetical protein n=1 Tax=Gemmatimonas sp. TaxID=1962908 RepID=UPI00391D2EE1
HPFARLPVRAGTPRGVDGADRRAGAERASEFAEYMRQDLALVEALARGEVNSAPPRGEAPAP